MHSRTRDNALPAGARLTGRMGIYTIVRVLGSGAYGITYLVSLRLHSGLDGGVFAVKEFFIHDIASRGLDGDVIPATGHAGSFSEYLAKFRREASNLSRMNHESIVGIFDTIEAHNTVYIVMRHIDGRNLDETILNHPAGHLDPAQALRVVADVGSALCYMHSHGMVHLDVKPSNIMMRSDGRAILIDFGLSRRCDTASQSLLADPGRGTEGYAPPEQSLGRIASTSPYPIDVYALGATLYKMLTGSRPPSASHIASVGFPTITLRQAGVPEHIIAVISRAMDPVPDTRYPGVSRMLADLGIKVTVRPQPAPKPGPGSRSTPLAWLHLLPAAALIICAAGVAFIAGHYRGHNKARSRHSEPVADSVARAPFTIVSSYTDGLALARNNRNRYGYVDYSDSVAIPFKYVEARPFSCGRAVVRRRNSQYYYINTAGHRVGDYYQSAESYTCTDGVTSAIVDNGSATFRIDLNGGYLGPVSR